MKYSDLMSLVESANGFVGGSIVDEMPSMSLTECTSALPVAILESQLDLIHSNMAYNDSLVEATITGIQTGSTYEMDTLVENALDNVIAKIRAFFARILKFIKSIIDKLGVKINQVRMSGKQMLAKYKGSDLLNHSFDGLTINGYKFKDGTAAFKNVESMCSNVQSLITAAVPGIDSPDTFKNAAIAAKNAKEDSPALRTLQEKMDALSEVEEKDRKLAFAERLVSGVDMTADEWTSQLKTALYGEKMEITYGSDGFTKDEVYKALEGADLDAIKRSYEKLKTAVEKDQATLVKAAEAFKKSDDAKAVEGKGTAESISLANKYFSTYLNVYQDCTAVISKVNDIRTTYEQDKVKQAKVCFSKMLTGKGKENNDAADFDGIDDFDVIL